MIDVTKEIKFSASNFVRALVIALCFAIILLGFSITANAPSYWRSIYGIDQIMVMLGSMIFIAGCLLLMNHFQTMSSLGLTLAPDGLDYPGAASGLIPWSAVAGVSKLSVFGLRMIIVKLSTEAQQDFAIKPTRPWLRVGQGFVKSDDIVIPAWRFSVPVGELIEAIRSYSGTFGARISARQTEACPTVDVTREVSWIVPSRFQVVIVVAFFCISVFAFLATFSDKELSLASLFILRGSLVLVALATAALLIAYIGPNRPALMLSPQGFRHTLVSSQIIPWSEVLCVSEKRYNGRQAITVKITEEAWRTAGVRWMARFGASRTHELFIAAVPVPFDEVMNIFRSYASACRSPRS